MSVFAYNGVTLPYPFHTDFRQEYVLDDTGQTDLIYSKYDITVQSIIHQDYLPVLAPEVNVQASSPADIMAYIRQKLKKPRRALTVQFGSLNLLPTIQEGDAGNVDAKNGPVPQYCNVTNLTNTSFLITFRIIAHYWENPETTPNGVVLVGRNKPGDSILYNRWTETQEIDRYLTSTYRREGKFLIRSDNVDGQVADWYRGKMAALGVLPGCNRVSANYRVSPDGLGIEYRIEDREFFRRLPNPAYEGNGVIMETGDNAVRRVCEVRISLRGAPKTSQSALMAVAILIGYRKLQNRLAAVSSAEPIITRVSFQSSIWQNEVTYSIQGWTNSTATAPDGRPTLERTAGGLGGVQALVNWIGEPNGPAQGPIRFWNNNHPQFPIQGGFDTSFLLRAAAYYDPSITNHAINRLTGQMGPAGLQVGQAGKNAEL